jgi:lysophospholipase L1-like esterase
MNRRAALALAASVLAAPGAAFGQAGGPTPFPASPKDWPGQGAIRVFGWMNDNRKAFWADRTRKQGSIVFAGDSLIGGWGTMGKDFSGLSVANRGIGGEVTRGLLFRFQEDVLDLHPKAIVLLSGSNDLSARQDPKLSRANLVAILDQATRQAPGTPVVLCTIPPRDHAPAPVDPGALRELNRLIAGLADPARRVVVLDLFTLLADADGRPEPTYFAKDGLHISSAGYQRFREALLPVLQQLEVA